MSLFSFDLETHLIQPGLLAPPLVCGSMAMPGYQKLLARDEAIGQFVYAAAGGETFVGTNIAFDFGVLAAEDPDLLADIFRLYEKGRVYDVAIAQALDAIAGGHLFKDPRTGGPLTRLDHRTGNRKITNRYSLEVLVELVLGRADAKKNDYWRLRYGILEQVPLSEWPTEARQYPIDDVVNTLEVAQAQRAGHRNLGDMSFQARAAWALHLGAIWGFRTNAEAVAALRARCETARVENATRFRKLGWVKEDGKDDRPAVKRAVARAYGASGACFTCAGTGKMKGKGKSLVQCKSCNATGLDLVTAPNLPRTPTGGVSADRDTLMESGDDDLAAFGSGAEEKILNTYVPWLEEGTRVPMNLRPNVLVATTRTSYDGLVQLIPRDGGVRDCFEARPGYVYCSTDYPAQELCTLAQVCLWTVGYSRMAETINASGDPGSLHTAFAAEMVGVSVDEMKARVKAKDKDAAGYRQAAKAANFGFPGGMGAAKLVLAKRKASEGKTVAPDGRAYPGIRFCVLLDGAQSCGVEKVTEWKKRPTPPICRRCVEVVEFKLRPAWFAKWPEMKDYFDWVSRTIELNGEIPCFDPTHPDAVAIVRGGVDFCNAANNGFQALAARAAKHALWLIAREAYVEKESPLYGTRPLTLIHDEVLSEMPEMTAHLAGPRQAALMEEGMRVYCPDIRLSVEPALMRRWYKAAEPVYKDGRLVVWEPKS